MKVKTVFKIIGWVVLGLCVAAAVAFLLGLAVQALWNWLMPAMFGQAVRTITYWQAVGIFILCHLLFKSHHEGHRVAARKGDDGHGRIAARIRSMIRKDREEDEGGAARAQPEGGSR